MSPLRRRAGAFACLWFAAFAAASPVAAADGGAGKEAARAAASDRRPGAPREFLYGVSLAIESPLHWRGDSFLKLAGVLGAGLAAFAVENDVRDWARRHADTGLGRAAVDFRLLGNGFTALALSGGLIAGGELFDAPGVARTGVLALESYVAASLIDAAGKLAFGRARPYAGEGHARFHPFSLENKHWSVPSGHAATAWSVATVIATRTDGVLADVACYGLAALASWSRVQGDKHWLSDVVLGSALGYFVGKKVCALDEAGAGARVRASFGAAPGPGGGAALTLGLSF